MSINIILYKTPEKKINNIILNQDKIEYYKL